MLYPTNFVPDKEISDIIAEIDEFKDFWNSHIDDLQRVLPDAATVRGMGKFNPVITPPTDDANMEYIFSRVSHISRKHDEIIGYDNLLNTIFKQYGHLELSQETIKDMHRILYLSEVNRQGLGQYKCISNRPYVIDNKGHIFGALFKSAPPIRVPRLMRELIAWAGWQLKQNHIHPIVVIGILKLHFSVIHPFTDGNGRISRALINLLMMKSGYLYMPYAPIEAIIEASRVAYHRALFATNSTIWSDKPNYTPWLRFLVLVLQEQKRYLEDIIKKYYNT